MRVRALALIAIIACASSKPKPPPPPPASDAAIAHVDAGDAAQPPLRGSLSARARHVCARTSDRRVACWGQLAFAASIARGSFAAPAQNPAVPEIVAGIGDVAGVEAGGSQHCAWTTHGEVWCWGWLDTERYEPPRRVAGLSDAVEVSGGEFDRMMCARRRTGHVACWGDPTWNADGAGAARGEAIVTPARVTEVPDLTDAAEIAVAFDRGCARRAGGGVACWTGLSPDAIRAVPEAAGAIGIGGFGGIGATASNFEALLPGGRVVAWEEPSGRARPARPVPADATLIAASWETCVAGRDVTCWHALDDTAQPYTIEGLIAPVAITAGDAVTCARTADGRASCWGLRGTLGDGTPSQALAAVEVPGLTDVTSISASGFTTCARRASGRVACWGNRLNAATSANESPPDDETPLEVPGITDALDVFLDDQAACARLASKKTVCWGWSQGATRADRLATPTPIPALTGVGPLFAGPCGIRAGKVTCLRPDRPDRSEPAHRIAKLYASGVSRVWGGGFARESWTCARTAHAVDCLHVHYGRGDTDVWPEHGFETLDDTVEVAAITGWPGMCARRSTGAVTCNANGGGEQGATTVDHATALAPGPDGGLCALRDDGHVVCWLEGLRLSGIAPVEIGGLTDAVEITGGETHACARRATGHVACWGDWERLGAGLHAEHPTPVEVKALRL